MTVNASDVTLLENELMIALDTNVISNSSETFIRVAATRFQHRRSAQDISCLVVMLAALFVTHVRADETLSISKATKDANGILVHEVQSPYQAKTTQIRILLPEKLAPDKKRAVAYVLPVEAGTQNRYGDGLLEIKRLDLHNTSGLIFVAPTFSHLPWYADHPSLPEIRQETYLTDVVVPFIDANYPAQTEAQGRLLLGFSKSGWGAWSMLLRHPDKFGKAVAWDAPLMMDQPGKYGSGDIFATATNFEKYRVSSLLKEHSQAFQDGQRLVLLGYGNFRAEHQQAHDLMNQLNFSHAYRDGPERKHDWHSGWVKDAVELLVANPAD